MRSRAVFFGERNVPVDVKDVLRTASLLSIPEFQVFRLAYARWFGREGSEQEIERHYLPYMFGDQVPHWVRSFTRHALDLARRDELDPAVLGIPRPRRNRRDVNRGRLFLLAIALTLTSLFLLARLATDLLGLHGCIFPPCY